MTINVLYDISRYSPIAVTFGTIKTSYLNDLFNSECSTTYCLTYFNSTILLLII